MTDAISLLIIDDSEDDRLLYRRSLQKNAGVAGSYDLRYFCRMDPG